MAQAGEMIRRHLWFLATLPMPGEPRRDDPGRVASLCFIYLLTKIENGLATKLMLFIRCAQKVYSSFSCPLVAYRRLSLSC